MKPSTQQQQQSFGSNASESGISGGGSGSSSIDPSFNKFLSKMNASKDAAASSKLASKKPSVAANSLIAYSPFAIANNHHIVEYCRTSMSALAGSTAGIIGLTSLQGFAFYLIMVVVLWAMLMVKAGANWRRYFTSRTPILTNNFIGGLTTYVLFWTFLYGMVHVY